MRIALLKIKSLQIYEGRYKVAKFQVCAELNICRVQYHQGSISSGFNITRVQYIQGSIHVKYNICKVQYLHNRDHYQQISMCAEISAHSRINSVNIIEYMVSVTDMVPLIHFILLPKIPISCSRNEEKLSLSLS